MVNNTCTKCNARIPKNRPQLKCSICNNIKHFKCVGLTKREAFEIIEKQPLWSCSDCMMGILPLNLLVGIRTNSENCEACSKKIGPSMVAATCSWCNLRCHKKCINGDLGCIRCCDNIIPGYNSFAHDLLGESHLESKPLFNPWDQEHLINQLGLDSFVKTEEALHNDFSSQISQCKYSTLNNLPAKCDGNPRILSLNIRCLFKGIDNLRENARVLQEKCDVLCLCETNLKLERLPNELDDISIEGFHKPIFKDPYRRSGKGGGLVIYVNAKFCDSEAITELEFIDTSPTTESDPPGEFLFIKIGLKLQNTNSKADSTKNIIVGNIYRSPSGNLAKFIKHMECHLQILEKKHKNKIIHIVGDFNIDLAKYDSDLHCHELINKMAEHNFAQIIPLPTRVTDHTSTIIDHIYSNQVHTLLTSRVVTLDISDHLGTYIQFNADPNFVRDNTNENADPLTEFMNFRKFNAANMEKFANHVSDETWSAVDDATSADEKYQKFEEIYTKHYDKSFESKFIRRKNQRKNPKPWILPWLEDACNRKNVAYYEKISNPSPENNAKYTKLKKFTDKHVKLAKKKFYSDYFENHQTNSKAQWQMMNSLLNRNKKRTKIDKIRDSDGSVATAPQAIAEKFNNYFANIAEKLKSKISSNIDATCQSSGTTSKNYISNSIYLAPTNSTEISQIIDNLKIKATADINVASIKRANNTDSKFSEVIADIVNRSFLEGVFPSNLKNAKVVPVHKGGSRVDIENYRPISLLSAFSKIFEKVMYGRVYDFLSHNSILDENQFGFRKGRSCEQALLTAQNEILKSLSKKQISLLLLIDFSKAFDMVDHDILLKKLNNYGIRGIAHDWFKSYLSDRTQYVTINGQTSSNRDMLYGVPQGSILGPLLFIIYINDIPNICENCTFILYADDANILISGPNMAEIENIFNSLARKLEIWVNTNGLALNLKKTNYIIFSNTKIHDIPFKPKLCKFDLERKSSSRFLGVIINEQLTWNQHILA